MIEEQCGVVFVPNNTTHKSHIQVSVSFPHGSFVTVPIVHLTVFLDQKQSIINGNNNRSNLLTLVANVVTTTTSGFCATVRRVSEKMIAKGWNLSQKEDEQIRLYWYATLPTNYLRHIVNQRLSKSLSTSSPNLSPSYTPPHQDFALYSSLNERHYHSSIVVQGNATATNAENSIIVVTVPLPQQQQQQQLSQTNKPIVPTIIATPHAINSSSEDVFVVMLREIYADRFVAVLRRVSFEGNTNSSSDSSSNNQNIGGIMNNVATKQDSILKLNWSAFYYNHSQALYDAFATKLTCKIPIYRQAATGIVGPNADGQDGVRRKIDLLQFTNRQRQPIADCLLCTSRCDPEAPGNNTICNTISVVQSNCFWICVRQVSPVHNIKDWNFKLYICYLAIYKNVKIFDSESSSITSDIIGKMPHQENRIIRRYEDIPFNQQLYICNRASDYVLDVIESQNRAYAKVGLWSNKIYLMAQNQRFCITADGFIVSALNSNLVLECIKSGVNQSVFINHKRENDNLTQKWIFRRVKSTDADQAISTTAAISDAKNLQDKISNVVESIGSTVNTFVGASNSTNETIVIASAADPSCVLDCASLQKGANCILQKASDSPSQQWYLKVAIPSFFQ